MGNGSLFQSPALKVLRYFAPKDVVGKKLVRLGSHHDGGYILVDDFGKCEAAYSIGIFNDVSWDLEIAKKGIDVFMYDHTIQGLPSQHERFHFFKNGICGAKCQNPSLKTFKEILKKNGHTNNKNLILKIDVEGAEYDSFENTESELIDNFAQIVIEFHDFCNLLHFDQGPQILKVLDKINKTHQGVHIHANNCCGVCLIDGVPIPQLLEITYVRRRDYQFLENPKCYPIEHISRTNQNIQEICQHYD